MKIITGLTTSVFLSLIALAVSASGAGQYGGPAYANPGYGAPIYGSPNYGSQIYGTPFDHLRSIVNRTQNDLRYAAGFQSRREDSQKRFFDAQGHLSTFDRKLVRGRFDTTELNRSIGKIRSILDKNVLQVDSRNALLRDLDELQAARYGRG